MVRHEADPLSNLLDGSTHIMSENGDFTCLWLQERTDDFERRRLAGTIWSYEPMQGLWVNLETDSLKCTMPLEGMRDILNIDDRRMILLVIYHWLNSFSRVRRDYRRREYVPAGFPARWFLL